MRQILDRGHLLRVRDGGHRQKSRLVGVKAALDRSRLGLGAEGSHLFGAPQLEPIKPELPGGRAFPTFPPMAAAVSPAAFKRFTLNRLKRRLLRSQTVPFGDVLAALQGRQTRPVQVLGDLPHPGRPVLPFDHRCSDDGFAKGFDRLQAMVAGDQTIEPPTVAGTDGDRGL